MKKILLLPIAFCYYFAFRAWLACIDMMDYYHFSSFDLKLQITNLITYDFDQQIFVTRFFHNKIVQFALDLYKRYTHFFDPLLFISLLSFVGFVGVLLGVWYFLKAKKKNYL